MSNRPLITVLMPVYNGADYVGSAVESILGQTLEDFEFIIVNDGSTDRTTSILRDCSRQDDRITVIGQPNLGYTRALNRGLSEVARGAFIARTLWNAG